MAEAVIETVEGAVVFTDIVGFTEYNAIAGDEQALELMATQEEIVERALRLVDRAEYKRRQAPPGVKLRPKSFGRDWRTPITNRFAG